jgi:hypothetical protein
LYKVQPKFDVNERLFISQDDFSRAAKPVCDEQNSSARSARRLALVAPADLQASEGAQQSSIRLTSRWALEAITPLPS